MAHFAIDLWGENFMHYIEGKELKPAFDGHANCFVEFGYGKGMLIDFNYTSRTPARDLSHAGGWPIQPAARNRGSTISASWRSARCTGKSSCAGLGMPLPPTMQMAGKQHTPTARVSQSKACSESTISCRQTINN